MAALSSGCLVYEVAKPIRIPAGTRVVRDIRYAPSVRADDDAHRLDLYLPPGPGPHPVLVFVHGGWWQEGGRRAAFGAYARVGQRFAARGVLTAVISYRLSPRVQHPEHVRDVARAIVWAKAHAKHFGGDPDRVFAAGHSAGAHLVLLAACDDRWFREIGADSRVLAGVIGISGPYDPADLATDPGSRERVERVFGSDAAVWANASVAHYLERGPRLPAILLAVADHDFPLVIRESRALAEALRAAGAPLVAREIAGRDHYSIVVELGDEGDPLAALIEALIAGKDMGAQTPEGESSWQGSSR